MALIFSFIDGFLSLSEEYHRILNHTEYLKSVNFYHCLFLYLYQTRFFVAISVILLSPSFSCCLHFSDKYECLSHLSPLYTFTV